jgi:hypothetical protein
MERQRIKKAEFIARQHFDKIPSWNMWECIEFLCCSDVNQGMLEGATPSAARAAAIARIEELVSESSSEDCIREADYAMIINTLNATKVVVESVLPGTQFPVLPHGGTLEDLAATHLPKLDTYTQQIIQYLQKHDSASVVSCSDDP